MRSRIRVMANSVVRMTQDAVRSFADLNEDLAGQVLAFDDTVDRFRNEILLSAEQKVAASGMPVRYAFRLRSTVAQRNVLPTIRLTSLSR